MASNESPDQYKKRLANDIQSAQVNQPPNPDQLETEPDENLVSLDIGDDEEEGQPQINQEQIENITQPQKPTQATTPAQQIQKAQKEVPKYVEQPSAAQEPQPGGPAVKPKGKTQAEQAKEQTAEKIKKQAGKEAQTVGKQATKAASDAAAQAGKAVAKWAAKAVAQVGSKIALATSETWVPILLAIVGIVLIIIAVVFLIRALQTPNGMGASPVEAADILGDRPWISKILALANDPNVATKLDGALTELEGGLVALEGDMAKPPLNSLDAATQTKITAKITEIRQLIVTFRSLPASDATRPVAAKNIVTAVSQLVDLFAPAPCRYDGPTTYPLDPNKISGWPDISGAGFHTGSYNRHGEDHSGHGLFINNKANIGDAVDIPAPRGTMVRTIFAGDYTKSNHVNGLEVWIEGKDNSGHTFEAVYAHMNEDTLKIHQGQKNIPANTPIAELNGVSHLHLEVYCNGRAIVTSKAEAADARNGVGKYGTLFGKYLYVRILNVFNLTPPF